MDYFASTTVSGGLADDPTTVLGLCIRYAAGDCFQYAPTGFLLHRPRAYVEALEWCRVGCAGHAHCLRSCSAGVGSQTHTAGLQSLRSENTFRWSAKNPPVVCTNGVHSTVVLVHPVVLAKVIYEFGKPIDRYRF